MNDRNLLARVLAIYNREQGTHITVEEDSRGHMTPETSPDEQSVIYNPHIDTLFLLLNMARMHKSAGCAAVHHFLLYHLALRRDLYREADHLLQELETDLGALQEAIPQNAIPFYRTVSDYQTLFVLAHEFSHIFYHIHGRQLEENRKKMKAHLLWLRRELNTGRPMLARILHFLIPAMRRMQEHSFDEAIADGALQEELLCDDAAWRMTHNIIRDSDNDPDIRATLSAYVAYTLYHIETQRTLENIYTTADRRERQRHLMFDTTRSTVLVNTIWDDVEAGSTGRYKALVNDMARSTRLHQMLSLRANLEHIGNIRNQPKGDYSPAELKRLDRRYNEVVEGLGI